MRFLLLAGAIALPCSAQQAVADLADLVLADVRVFDSRTKEVSEPVDVVVRGPRIAAIGPAGSAPDARRTIAGHGRLLVPGLVDTHVHLHQILRTDEDSLPQSIGAEGSRDRATVADWFLPHGTTAIVDMGMPESWLATAVEWQRAPAADLPLLRLTGSALISDLEWDRHPAAHHVVVADPAAARAKVREYAGLGLQHVKLYWKLLAPEFEAAAVAAKEQGLIAAAHVDNGLYSMDAALAHGVRHFEHFFTLVPSILDTRRHGPALEREFGIGRAQNIDELAARFVLFFAYVKQRPELEARLLAQMDRLAAADASLSTAIHVVGAAAGATTLFSSFDPLPERDAPQLRGWDDEQRRRLRAAFDTMMGFVRAAHERGVRLRIGTDCREGGRAVLSELRLLCEAGFETADVLQIATWNGADAMGLCAEVGVVEVGRRASMILWQDDPLADPAHLQGDKIVIHEGVVLGEPR
ncbi:MAG: amidohydrolase family protein [Planctomycetes bacterium]|nr:amidohydrolase family protein [Planctomycetota bacterium]